LWASGDRLAAHVEEFLPPSGLQRRPVQTDQRGQRFSHRLTHGADRYLGVAALFGARHHDRPPIEPADPAQQLSSIGGGAVAGARATSSAMLMPSGSDTRRSSSILPSSIDIDSVSWHDELFANPPAIEDGELVLPTGPGWGVEVNEKAVRAHPPRLH
jgi:hypothetical protein